MNHKSVCFDVSTGSFHAGTIAMTLHPWASEGGEWKLLRSEDRRTVWKNGCGTWHFEVNTTDSGLSLRLTGALCNPFPGLHFGWKAEEPLKLTHSLGVGEKMGRCKPLRLPCSEERSWDSTSMTILTCGHEHLMIAAPLRNPAWTVFRATAREQYLDDFQLDCRIAFDTGLVADTGWIEFSVEGDPFSRMTDWADVNATIRKDFNKDWIAGWNSWDYYRWTITEEEILNNARFIAADPILSKYVKRVIVDDGWQYCYGEWEPNPLFHHGMEYLAKELTALGFEPGLWIAPTIIEPHCRIGQLNKEMLALSEGGQPCLGYSCMERHGFLLDPTVPASREYITKVFNRYASIGYKFFKLDFMASTMAARKFHDSSVPRTEIPRLIVQAVSEGVKGRAQILGCNFMFCGGNEFVDSVRIGADIHAKWKNIEINAESVATLFHTHQRLWLNDPDFSLARGPETSDDPDLNKLQCAMVYARPESLFVDFYDNLPLATMSKAEAEVLLSMTIVSGGVMNFSDNLPKLNDAGLDLIRRAASAPHGPSGKPLDLFESQTPGIWVQHLEKMSRVLLINWNDESLRMTFDLKTNGIMSNKGRNFWSDQILTAHNAIIKTELPPHHCLLAEFDKA